MVSLKDIAARCGVSIATVSKALNDHRDIGQETKERIRQTASKYQLKKRDTILLLFQMIEADQAEHLILIMLDTEDLTA